MNGRYVLFVWALLLAESDVFCASKIMSFSKVVPKIMGIQKIAPRFFTPLMLLSMPRTGSSLLSTNPSAKPQIMKKYGQQQPRQLESLEEYKKKVEVANSPDAQEYTFAFTYAICNNASLTSLLPDIIKLIGTQKPDIVGFRGLSGQKDVLLFELNNILEDNDYELINFYGPCSKFEKLWNEIVRHGRMHPKMINFAAFNRKKFYYKNSSSWLEAGKVYGGAPTRQNKDDAVSWLLTTLRPNVAGGFFLPDILIGNIVQIEVDPSETPEKPCAAKIADIESGINRSNAIALIGGHFKVANENNHLMQWMDDIYGTPYVMFEDAICGIPYLKNHGYVPLCSSNEQPFQQDVLCKQFGDIVVTYVPSCSTHNSDSATQKSEPLVLQIAITCKKSENTYKKNENMNPYLTSEQYVQEKMRASKRDDDGGDFFLGLHVYLPLLLFVIILKR